MTKWHVRLAAAGMMVGMSAPAIAQEDARSTVTALDAQYDKVWNTRDAEKLSALFASDAVVLPPIAPAGRGPQAVVAFFGPLFQNKWSGHKLEPISAQQVSDNTIIASAHWSANLADASGKTTRYHGDVAQVFTKAGDQWKIHLTSWNLLTDK